MRQSLCTGMTSDAGPHAAGPASLARNPTNGWMRAPAGVPRLPAHPDDSEGRPMPPFSRPPVPARAVLAVLAAPALLAACATPLQPVADFGGAAGRLATVYEPFAAGLGRSCVQKQRVVALGNPGPYDDAAAQRDADRLCAPLRKEAATAALFARALSDYAGALVKLSGTRPTAFDGAIKGVSGAAAKLDGRDGSALFDARKLGAATRLARAAAALALQERTGRLARATLEDNQDALAVVVGAMKTYAEAIYAGQLRDTREAMQGELARLVAASDAPTQAEVEARLPWRLAQQAARDAIAADELEQRRVAAFARSADALLAAHAALVADFDRLDGARRLALVSAFVAEVEAIDDDVAELQNQEPT